MKKPLTIALVLSLGVAGVGLGTVASAKMRGAALPAFSDLDTDGDDVISAAEMTAFHSAKFTGADSNGDGFLDLAELGAMAKAPGPRRPMPTAERIAGMVEKLMARADKNGDAVLSRDEVKGPFAHKFDTVDADSDGVVSAEELQASILKRAEGHGPRLSVEERVAKMLEHADKDGDGMLDVDEAKPQNATRFLRRMDSDEDGAISKAEWDAAVAHRRGHSPGNG